MRYSEFQQADQDITEGPNDPHIFKAVFMAGSPGSGKSTVARELFSGTGLKTLNVDRFWQLYKRKNKRGDYEKFWDLYQKQEGGLLKGKLGLIIDGTGKNPNVQQEIKNRLEAEGYDTLMVFVETDEQTAQARARSRASDPGSPDYERHVDPEFVKTTYNRVMQAKPQLKQMFGNQFLVVDNSDQLDVSRVEKTVRRWLNQPPQNPVAQQWLDQHRNQRLSTRGSSPEPNTRRAS